jgi:hypothetical protein
MRYAEDIDGNRIHIDDAVKGVTYYFRYEDKEYEIIVAHGDKNIKHYKTKIGDDIYKDDIFHKDCQLYLKKCKHIHLGEGYFIKANKVLLEHEAARYIKKLIPDYKMIPDCLFLDANDDILCILEVNVTHPKSEDDIKKIQQYKIITYELTYGKARTDYINPIRFDILYESEENNEFNALRSKIEKQKNRIRKANYCLQQQQEEIRSIEQLLIDKLILNYEQTKQTETT